MTVEELIIYGKKYLHSNEVKIILSSIIGCDTLELLNYLDKKISTKDVETFKKMINARLNNYPLQYIVGNVNFYGYDFIVRQNVLIPRFETEQLVYYVSKFIKDNYTGKIDIIDVGCGSGIIGITLSKIIKNCNVTCVDISDYALDLTKDNSIKLGVDINIIKSDMLDNVNETFDVIVSNPPYIAEDEKIEDIVKNNEPHIALYGGSDGLLFYKKILSTAKEHLKDNFLIAFEIGENQASAISDLANDYLDNINIDIYKDLSNRDRIVLIYNKNE